MRFARLLALLILAGCVAVSGVPRSDDVFARIRPGMTEAEVASLTGRPDNVMPFPMSATTSWGFYYFDTWGYYCEFSVTFGPDGRVLSKISRRISDGRGKD
jgi:hypothetical protein